MAGQKLIPTRFHEIRRWLKDRGIARQLQRPEGRARYWNELVAQCANRSLVGLLESTLSLPGDVIECGVFRGASLQQMACALKESGSQKCIYGLDSFEGFPEGSVQPCDVGTGRWFSALQKKFRFCADTPAHLRGICNAFDLNVELIPGYFCDTLPRVKDRTFCFIHIDVDLYQSYKECLEALYDRLVPGGVIVFDEWKSGEWPGATQAINEFLSNHPEEVQQCTDRKQFADYIRKQSAVATRAVA